MLRKMAKIFLAVLITCVSVIDVYAADQRDPVTVLITVNCKTEEDDDINSAVIEPVDEGYRYTIKEGDLMFTGSEEKVFVLEFTEPGNYCYEVRQSETQTSSEHMDTNTHIVKVYVEWNNAGTLVANPVVFQKGHKEKELEISFLNLPKSYYLDEENKEAILPENSLNAFENSSTSPAISVQTGDDTATGPVALLFAGSALFMILISVIKASRS